MALDKLRGMFRLGSSQISAARFKGLSSGAAASTWTETDKLHYQFTAGATLRMEVHVENHYSKRNRNKHRIIGTVDDTTRGTIDYLVCAGGGAGNGASPSGSSYGGGGGGGGGGVLTNAPQCPAPLRSPTSLNFVSSIPSVVGGVNNVNGVDNPFADKSYGDVDFPLSVGAGGPTTNVEGSPSAIDSPAVWKSFTKSPTIAYIEATGGGSDNGVSGGPGGSGGGGTAWNAGGGGSGIPGQGNPGATGGGSGPGPAPSPGPGGQGGGGGGFVTAGENGNWPANVGSGGNGQAMTFNGTPITFGGGGGGAGRPGVGGPPHGTSYPGRPNAPGGTGGGSGSSPAPTSNSYGGGGGGNGGAGAPGTIIIAFPNQVV